MSTQPSVAVALEFLRSGDARAALRELEALVEREPASPAAHNAFGSVLAGQGNAARAATEFECAIALRADYPEALTNLGSLRLDAWQLAAALELFGRALALPRVLPQAHVGMGRALCLLGRHAAARPHFERACALAPQQASIHSQRCYAGLFDPSLGAAELRAIQRGYETCVAPWLQAPAPRFDNDPRSDRKLVLGYVSADFREHSVASFLTPMLAAHDRSAVSVRLYSDVARPDATTQHLREFAADYVSIVGASHAAVAARIRADRVDVLIDLAGHMQPNRLPVIAQRPAPVLFSYLGYPGTTGLRAFAARISDAWADPPDADTATDPEALLRIEGGYFAYGPPADAPDVAAPPVSTTGEFTFGCMNDALKWSDAVLACWAEILTRAPGSRLLLKARALAAAEMRARVVEAFSARGVSVDRLELLPATPGRREHLLQYARVDLALDTFPYAGATTTCEALYMGVPVVSLAGDRHVSRLGVSVLSAAGLSAFITDSQSAYVELALRCAQDVRLLASLRATLRERLRSSALCSGQRVARAIECASREYFGRWASARA
jgi:predicted O-linked N-acetylglucosamine transferase (SPINDLY family)